MAKSQSLNLELMMGLEPMTSPLPRECSTTELHQPACCRSGQSGGDANRLPLYQPTAFRLCSP